MKINWDDSLMASGIQKLDRYHMECLSRFNEFEQAIDMNNDEQACTRALLFFIYQSDTHSMFEEALMEKYHSTGRQVNKAEHGKFRARIQEISYMTWPSARPRKTCLRWKKNW